MRSFSLLSNDNALSLVQRKCYFIYILSRSNVAVLLSLMVGPVALPGNTIVAYVEAPTIQASSVPSITTETFDALTPGIYSTSVVGAIGTYVGTSTIPFAIVGADSYGGAGGSGRYFAVGSESGSAGAVVLDLSSEENYFGFWWSAGDSQNSVTFLQDGTPLATFTTANLVTLLPRSAGLP